MTVSISTLPAYVAAGEQCAFVGTCTVGADEDTEWSLTATPQGSRLALGQIVERHPTVVRTLSVRMTFNASSAAPLRSANITRAEGSFVTDGYKPGMAVDITGTSSNNKRVTLAAVTAGILTLDAKDVLTAETATASLLGATYGTGGKATNLFTFDVPGEFTVEAFEYFNVEAIGSYSGDPLGAAQHILQSTASATIYVGGYVELPIKPVNGHASTLRLLVVNDTVRRAELVSPATDLARVAALDSTVAAAVTAIEGVAVNSLDVDFVTDVNAIATAYQAHRILVGGPPVVHYSADTTNVLLREPANSIPAAIQRLNDIAVRLTAHQQATSAGGTWHAADDGKNTLAVAPTATTLGEATVLKADLRERVYERHRVQTSSPTSHGVADNTNMMDPPATLPAAIAAYLDFVTTSTPSSPAGEPEGIGDAVAGWGFTASRG